MLAFCRLFLSDNDATMSMQHGVRNANGCRIAEVSSEAEQSVERKLINK